ncbi:MAG TPA: heme-binding domain-containing protein [Candidatus Binataceae bacterium]|nr:heme-binding domain-containing protein [Candidatus Binataceae bacterium]
MRWPARLFISASALVIAAQLIRPERVNPPVHGDLSAPPAIKEMLSRACYDCHSNQTKWPWYSAIAPMSWWVYRDVERGRQPLNFSNWSDYAADPGTMNEKLDKMAKLLDSGAMPPWWYRELHPESRLTFSDRDAILRWIGVARDPHAQADSVYYPEPSQ